MELTREQLKVAETQLKKYLPRSQQVCLGRSTLQLYYIFMIHICILFARFRFGRPICLINYLLELLDYNFVSFLGVRLFGPHKQSQIRPCEGFRRYMAKLLCHNLQTTI